MHTDSGTGAVEVTRQLPLADGIAQRLGDTQVAVKAKFLHAFTQAQQLAGVLAFVTQDVVNALALRILRQSGQRLDQQLTHAAQRIRLIFALAGARQLLEGQAQAFEHGLKQVYLVLEMPVDGAAADAGFLRHFGQRRTGSALGMEYPLGGVEYLCPCRLRFLFGSSGHLATWFRLAVILPSGSKGESMQAGLGIYKHSRT